MLTWPPSSDGGIHPYVASVVRRGNPSIRGLRRQTGESMLTWPSSSDGGIHAHVASVVRRGGSAASTRTTPVLPDLTIEAT